MEIAGLTGQVESLFESTRDYCRKYLAEAEPDFTVPVAREDLAFEQALVSLAIFFTRHSFILFFR